MDTVDSISPSGLVLKIVNDKSTLESIISQVQKFSKFIYCVRDGEIVLIYNDNGWGIPPNIKLEHERTDEYTGLYECYFRSTEDDSLYCFFYREIKEWIITERRTMLNISNNNLFSRKFGITSAINKQILPATDDEEYLSQGDFLQINEDMSDKSELIGTRVPFGISIDHDDNDHTEVFAYVRKYDNLK